MKHFVSLALGALLLGAAAFGMTACNGNEPDDPTIDPDTPVTPVGPDTPGTPAKTYSVYAPDGAPALALVNAIEDGSDAFEYHVVDSSTIQTYVTGAEPVADFCILPLNAASKLLGTGTTYEMLGTVTNGNIFFLSAEDNEDLTKDNLSTLIGKSVGVVQLPNVPGLTLQVVLNMYGIDYQIVENGGEEAADKVNLIAFDPANVTPAGGCDYYLCPEPAASTKIKGTASAQKPFRLAGDLQELYGGEEGYPQAVLVAKKSVLEGGEEDKGAVDTMLSYMEESGTYLETVTPETVLSALDGVRTEGLSASFNANNLTAEVIDHCSVRFTAASECKEQVNAFLEELIAVNGTSAAAVSDDFFYNE